MAIKMYCIFSRDALKKMNGNRGKLAAQAGHAYLHAYWDAERRFPSYEGGLGGDFTQEPELYQRSERAYKICLIAESDIMLGTLLEEHKAICGVTKVVDAGLTVFEEPTLTCVGIGPIREEDRSDLLKSLKPLI